MPTYQYVCTECGAPLEAVQSFSDPALTVCPTCGGTLRKVFSAVGVVFKGSGFYRTDSRTDGKSAKSNGSSSGPKEAKDSKNGSKPDSKPDAKPAPAKSDGSSSSASSSTPAAPARSNSPAP